MERRVKQIEMTKTKLLILKGQHHKRFEGLHRNIKNKFQSVSIRMLE